MRPIKIKMSAFGSYANEVEIDFSAVGRGIFLITGDTGAGKTTIFDAISYALYDRTSGGKRDGQMMRSQYAPDDVPTYVELTFQYGKDCYTVRRSPKYASRAKRRNKDGEYSLVVRPATVELIMPDGKAFLGKIKDIDAKIVEIIGLDANQFSQIAMIAQGDFLELLHARSDERRVIFSKIFNTYLYQRIQDIFRNRSKELYIKLDSNRKLYENQLNMVVCDESSTYHEQWKELTNFSNVGMQDILRLLGDIVEEDKENEQRLKRETKELEQYLEQERAKLKEIKDVEKKLVDKSKRALELKNSIEEGRLRLALEQQELKELRISNSKQEMELQQELIELKNSLDKYQKLSELRSKCADLHKLQKDGQELLEKLFEDITLAKQSIEDFRHDQEKIPAIVTQRSELSQRAEELENAIEILKKYKQAKKALVEAELQEERSRSKYIELAQQAEEKNIEYIEQNRIFVQEQAGIIASQLQVGMPCPVCGSIEHPSPAELPEIHVTQETVENAQKEREQAEQRAEDARAKMHKDRQGTCTKQAIVEGMEDNLRRYAEILPDTCDIEKAEDKLVTIKNEIVSLDKEYTAIKNEQEKLDKVQKWLVDKEPELESEREKLAEYKLMYEVSRQQMQELGAILKLESRAEADIRISEIDDIMAELKKSEQGKTQKYMEDIEWLRRSEGILEQQEMEQHVLTEEKKGLILQIQEKQCTEAVEEENWSAIYCEEISKREIQLNELREQEKRSFSKLQQNRTSYSNIEQHIDVRTQLEQEYALVSELDRTVNGNLSGKAKLDLQTFIQRAYFQEMINAANRRLSFMVKNKFLLQCRDIKELSAQGSVGLDLDVYQTVTGKTRDVKTLSGGESFMAALAMAFGMADVIQESAGRIRMDMMFIDEGFGSLDDNSRSQAIQVLQEMSGQDRMIGIISHVTELKEQIDKKLVVNRTENGSSVKWEL